MNGDRSHRAPRWRSQLPEPDLAWIRWSPQPWAGPAGGVWTDLGRAGLAWGRGTENGAQNLPLIGHDLDDVVYLPPTTDAGREQRSLAAASLAEQGSPVLVHLFPGEEWPSDGFGLAIFDLLPGLWRGDLGAIDELPGGSAVVWPLIRGVTDDQRTVSTGLERLKRRGVEAVLGLPLDLSPGDRREVVRAHGDEVFDLVFHGDGSSARRFARAAEQVGLRWWLERPSLGSSAGPTDNRRLSGALLAIAGLWSRLGRSPVRGQSYYRAARWIDNSRYEVTALLREGNLEVIEAVDPASREVIREVVELGESAVLDELRRSFVDLSEAPGN